MLTLSNHREFKLFRDGSTSAFLSLVNRHHSLLHQYIFLRCGETALTAKYLQQIFAEAWDNRASFDSEGQFLCYLYLIAGDKLLGIEQSREQREMAEQDNAYGWDATNDWEDEETERIRYYIFSGEVERLPAQRKKVFKKIYFGRMTTHEVSEEMGIAEQTVLNQKAKAKNTLKKTVPPIYKSYLLTGHLPQYKK